MTASTLAIPFAFILLAGLLCWLIIGVKGHWAIKLPVLIVVPLFGIAVWSAVNSYQGWPTPEIMPEKTQLLWAEVHEPDMSTGDSGSIYIWAIPLVPTEEPGVLEYHGPQGEPRAYVLPYSRKLHELLHAAKGKLARGEPILLQRERRRPGRPGQERGSDDIEDDEFHLYDLPPAPLPQKGD